MNSFEADVIVCFITVVKEFAYIVSFVNGIMNTALHVSVLSSAVVCCPSDSEQQ
jgi:hypothetical protein